MRRKLGSRVRRFWASPGLPRNARSVELMVPGDFLYSLMMLCYYVLHVLRHFLHCHCCVEDMCSHLQLLELEGCIARKLHFHIVIFCNWKEASHESVIFTSSTRGIARKPRTKASFSHLHELQLLEFDGSIARKLRFYTSWMRFER